MYQQGDNMNLPIINIGNSKGIRIRKSILEKYNIKDQVEVALEDDRIIIKRSEPRKGWEKKFAKMHENEDDELLIDDVFEDEEFEE